MSLEFFDEIVGIETLLSDQPPAYRSTIHIANINRTGASECSDLWSIEQHSKPSSSVVNFTVP